MSASDTARQTILRKSLQDLGVAELCMDDLVKYELHYSFILKSVYYSLIWVLIVEKDRDKTFVLREFEEIGDIIPKVHTDLS